MSGTRTTRRLFSVVVGGGIVASVVAAGLTTIPALAADRDRPRPAPPSSPRESGGLTATHERYPGPYHDLSGARRYTVADVLALGDRGGLDGPQDLGAAVEPGVDPPYEPTRELQELKAPWVPPVDGPDAIASGPPPPPAGPSGEPPTPWDRVRPVPQGCVGSKFVYRSVSGTWRPAFGWTAHVWLRGDDAHYADVGSVELDTFGEWEYCPTLDQAGRELLYVYEAQNTLLELLDLRPGSGGYYQPYWVKPWPTMTNPPAPGIYPHAPTTPWVTDPGVAVGTVGLDTGGHNFGDVAPNHLYALGDVMAWAMEALTTAKVFGIGVQRTDPGPHRLLYPNTGMGCGADAPEKWSCYRNDLGDRPMYLGFQASQVTRFVVQHEVAHSIEAMHRSNTVGGRHEQESCSTKPQLAYEEGFANFFAYWARTPDRTKEPPIDDADFDIEAPNECQVVTGQGSEVWIAAALWDIHDHHTDFGDTLGAKGFGGVVKLYLADPATDIVELRHQYLAMLSAGSKAWANAVFDQNHIPS